MRNSAIYYVSPEDIRKPGGLDKFKPYGVVLCGGACSEEDVGKVVAAFPEKIVGAYLLTSDLSPTLAGYPGPMAKYTGTDSPFVRYGVGTAFPLYHVGLLSDATVQWTVERAKAVIGDAKVLMLDCFSPKNCDWKPGVDFDGDGIADTFEKVAMNWREYTVKTVAALHAAMPDILLVPNVGHSVAPNMVSEPLRTLYRDYCAHVNGVGVEGRALSPAAWGGPARTPRMSILFTESVESFDKAMGMALPPNVVPAVRSWLVKS